MLLDTPFEWLKAHSPAWGESTGFFDHKIHVLVVFLPVAFALGLAEVIGHLHISPWIILFVPIVALVPIANCISASTDVANEKLKINGHPTLGMLLNVTFANVVEIIVALIALFVQKDEVIALYSLIGSWISNYFLLMGVVAVICSFKGCTFRGMNETTAQTHTLLLLLASAGYMLASALPFFPIHTRIVTAQLFLGVAIMFVVLYAVFVLGFQLRTHEAMAEDQPSSFREGSRERKVSTAVKQDKAPDHANLSVAVLFMVIWTGLAAATLLKSVGISKIFFALIILPVFGNLFEHWTAITAALKGNLTGAFNVAAGSALQIAMGVLPLLIIISHASGKHLDMAFDVSQAAVILSGTVIIGFAFSDSRTHWLEGLVILFISMLSALLAWFQIA
ncbi:hypothetical protein R3P38DRAFT_2541931 [Favolaschia claudopus]|uniref:Sodium/calcium exchanger membrane region domain-containing protein n=1 Tax=Favolaschia claudopus TaxID=2862362 RepID=A0AAW0AU51_9AGAR